MKYITRLISIDEDSNNEEKIIQEKELTQEEINVVMGGQLQYNGYNKFGPFDQILDDAANKLGGN